jgi:hypothetical protein
MVQLFISNDSNRRRLGTTRGHIRSIESFAESAHAQTGKSSFTLNNLETLFAARPPPIRR